MEKESDVFLMTPSSNDSGHGYRSDHSRFLLKTL